MTTQSVYPSPSPTLSPRPLRMPDALKNDLLDKAIHSPLSADRFSVEAVNAETASRFPGLDFYIQRGPGVIECHSKTVEPNGTRHLHLLRYDCRETMPGRPCQHYVYHCSDCRGYAGGGCRHASDLTGVLNHIYLQEQFKSSGSILCAYRSNLPCTVCGETMMSVRVGSPKAFAGVQYAVCIGIRGGVACPGGIVL